jgi:hypothetical protein
MMEFMDRAPIVMPAPSPAPSRLPTRPISADLRKRQPKGAKGVARRR